MAFVLVTVLSTLAMAAASTSFLRGQLLADLQQRDLYRATATAKALDAYLTSLSSRLKEAAASPQAAAFITQPEAGQGRANVESGLIRLTADNGYEAVVITDRSGKAVAASDPHLLGTSFATNPVFVWAVGGLTAIDDPVFEPTDKQVYIYFSAPVSATGAPVGTVIGRIPLNAIDAIVERDSNFTGHGEFGVLWNEHGIRLSQPSDASLFLRPLAQIPQNVVDHLATAERFGPKTRELIQPASPWPEVMESSQSLLRNRTADPHLRVSAPNSDALQVSIAPLEKMRWFYGIAAPETSVNAAITAQWRLLLLVALGAAVIAAIAAIFMARGISRAMAGATMILTGEGASTEQPSQVPPSTTPENRQTQAVPGKEPQREATEPSVPKVPEAPQATPTPQEEPVKAEKAAVEETIETRPVSEAPAPEALSEEPTTEPSKTPQPEPPEASSGASSGTPEIPSPPANLLSVPERSKAPAIAPVPIKVELARSPEPALLQVPAVDAGETKQEPPASPQEAAEPETPRKPGWGIPLARPPLGPMS